MPTTLSQIQALNFNYLTGLDLCRWCAGQILIKQYDLDNSSLQEASDTAIDELKAAMRTKYDLSLELAKTGADRERYIVKILSILAVRNAMGSFQNISEKDMANFEWADKEVKAIRAGQGNFVQPPLAATTTLPDGTVTTGPASIANVVASSYSFIG